MCSAASAFTFEAFEHEKEAQMLLNALLVVGLYANNVIRCYTVNNSMLRCLFATGNLI